MGAHSSACGARFNTFAPLLYNQSIQYIAISASNLPGNGASASNKSLGLTALRQPGRAENLVS